MEVACVGIVILFTLWNNKRARWLLHLSYYYLLISRLIHYTKTCASWILYWAANIQHLHRSSTSNHAVVIVSLWKVINPFERTLQNLVAIRVQVDSFSVSVCQIYESIVDCPEVDDHLLLKYSSYILTKKIIWNGRKNTHIFILILQCMNLIFRWLMWGI